MVVPAALCATVAVTGWVAGGPAGLDSRTTASAETPIEVIQIEVALSVGRTKAPQLACQREIGHRVAEVGIENPRRRRARKLQS